MDKFIPFLRAVGRGDKLKRDLTQDEAKEAMRLILTGQATPAQIGGFLISQRVKGESVAEIIGFTEAARQQMEPIAPRVDGLIDLALPYDGKAKTLQLGPTIAMVLAAAGQPVVLHGDRNIPTKEGVGPIDVLERLGIEIDQPLKVVSRQIEQLGIGFLYAPHFIPAWHGLTPIRQQFGLRTVMNTVEKFLNPANAPISVSGFFHRNYILRMLGLGDVIAPDTWLIQGAEGSIESPPHRGNPIYKTCSHPEPWIVKGIEMFPEPAEIKAPPDPLHHANITSRLLNGERGPAYDTVCLTSAILLVIGGRVSDVSTGVALADGVLASGRGMKVLLDWRNYE